MFKIQHIVIDGFWKNMSAEASLWEDVNIIIGKNGSGKTTFMNILYAVLSVDIDLLSEASFSNVVIKISDGRKTRTIKATKTEAKRSPFPIVEYYISNRRYYAQIMNAEEGRMIPPSVRRRVAEEAIEIKTELAKLVSLASLSVYRMGTDLDPDSRERAVKRQISPVDLRLESLTKRLAIYQLELSDKARSISAALQRGVLTSLLYEKENAPRRLIPSNFEEAQEVKSLSLAYDRLGLKGPVITQRIQNHVAAAKTAVAAFDSWSLDDKDAVPPDLNPLNAFRLTSQIVEMSLAAEREIKDIFRQPNLFIEKLKEFIPAKSFRFAAGELEVTNEGTFFLGRLSSGEKQLLILFIEALLQRETPYIFLADEPELSLHISWQRAILGAIRSINPNAQIIVATHSPEIAGRFRAHVLNMEKILHG